ncbi:MAG: RNA polymerase-associated protein RapA, partial [Fibrobacterota bacterium]|nr:RNA polymerase-associated protein RapA [Chitinispirillaceae bacterium]
MKTSSKPVDPWKVGQRWISEMEPELGLGSVKEFDNKRITIAYHDGETVRVYIKENAPLRRVRFKDGHTISTTDNRTVSVVSVFEEDNIIYYKTSDGTICETELSYANRITTPMERIISSHVDTCDSFRLRKNILDLKFRSANSPVRGFVGGRVELIPHQLYIANEVSSRFTRRIMLADEVGLGKTIEACLILHRLLVSGRVSQVLIIVPESMVHVWFVELLRKFNLLFTIIEKDSDDEFGDAQFETNPFCESSLVLIGMNQLLNDDKMVKYASEVSWDVLITDEAHHLVKGSASFEIVESISRVSKDLFLLTATPQHFGEQNHFARLQLLDPYRYTSYDTHCKEADEHRTIAILTGKMLDGNILDNNELDELAALLHSDTARSMLQSHNSGTLSDFDRKQIVAEILDRQGIGRALFRNTRAVIGGFPERKVFVEFLDASKEQRLNVLQLLRDDLKGGGDQKKRKLTGDPRIKYLAELLRKTNDDKILVICRSKHTVFALDEALQKEISVKTGLFHEELTLLQRDRNAAWFSEEDGARILICSEIGSEGRNFQFSHHLFLFDLPGNPELVEQRIGRLDRIGQRNTVKIYVPVLNNTPESFLAKWYHEGLGIFESTQPAAQEAYEKFEQQIQSIIQTDPSTDKNLSSVIDTLIVNTKKAVDEISIRLKNGRDRLLEQHSFRPRDAQLIVEQIKTFDNDESLRSIMRGLLHARGILAEEFCDDTWNLLADSQVDETFPGLNPSRTIVTFNRSKALHREDYEFMTIDHPAVTGGMDIFLSSETGNASFSVYRKGTESGLLLEAVFVAECIAPLSLYLDRFLPPFVFRIIIDNKGFDKTSVKSLFSEELLESVNAFAFMEKPDVKQKLLPAMLKKAENAASVKCVECVKEASLKIKNILGTEINRLEAL